LQRNFINFKLKTITTIYRLILIITLFLIFIVNVCFLAARPDTLFRTDNNLTENITLPENKDNLELKNDDSTTTSTGLKVEIVTISCPVSFDSGDNHISNLNFLTKIYSKKKYSLVSHSNQFISKTLHLSPLITKLQI